MGPVAGEGEMGVRGELGFPAKGLRRNMVGVGLLYLAESADYV